MPAAPADRPRRPIARQAEHAAAQHPGREVLLRDRDLAALPAPPDLSHRRQNDPGGAGVDREPRQRVVEDRVRARLVEALERRR